MRLELSWFGGHPEAFARGVPDAQDPPAECRRQLISLGRGDRDPDDLPREFELTAPPIRNRIADVDKSEARREEVLPGLNAAERDGPTRLRRENKQLRLKRDTLQMRHLPWPD